MNKGATTRRIRKRAATWRALRPVAGAHVERLEANLRSVAQGVKMLGEPPHSRDSLRALVEEQLADNVRGLRYQLRERLRSPGMARYHRDQAVKALNVLRSVPDAREALERVLPDLPETRPALGDDLGGVR